MEQALKHALSQHVKLVGDIAEASPRCNGQRSEMWSKMYAYVVLSDCFGMAERERHEMIMAVLIQEVDVGYKYTTDPDTLEALVASEKALRKQAEDYMTMLKEEREKRERVAEKRASPPPRRCTAS